jgi:hypothetical protein
MRVVRERSLLREARPRGLEFRQQSLWCKDEWRRPHTEVNDPARIGPEG